VPTAPGIARAVSTGWHVLLVPARFEDDRQLAAVELLGQSLTWKMAATIARPFLERRFHGRVEKRLTSNGNGVFTQFHELATQGPHCCLHPAGQIAVASQQALGLRNSPVSTVNWFAQGAATTIFRGHGREPPTQNTQNRRPPASAVWR